MTLYKLFLSSSLHGCCTSSRSFQETPGRLVRTRNLGDYLYGGTRMNTPRHILDELCLLLRSGWSSSRVYVGYWGVFYNGPYPYP